MKEREALKLAQKALSNRNAPAKTIYEALHAIKEALAQPEQEPTRSQKMRDAGIQRRLKGWGKEQEQLEHEPAALQMDVIVVNLVREGINKHRARELAEHFIKHTTPPERTWVGLTDVEWMNIVNKDQAWFGQRPDEVAHEVAKMVEAKLREKNT